VRRVTRAAGRIAKAVGVAALVLASVGLLGVLVASQAAGYRTLVVRSGSMTGTADVGSLVIARPIEPEAVDPGDIILMQRQVEGVALEPVLHRVVEVHIDDDGQVVVRTKGDASSAVDPEPYILRGTVVTPVLVIERVGLVVGVIQKPAGWLGLVVLPMSLVTAAVLYRVWRPEETVPTT